ncbi:hypothetical protein ACFPT0_13050, partial [Acinetobacter portensis]|uniref:hypothetical protein n=1 Tax=Acinetobacter portensis TaxID=1839785 RepID=UPI003622D7D0
QASSFENYIAEKPFTDRFVQQSPADVLAVAKVAAIASPQYAKLIFFITIIQIHLTMPII